MSKVIGKLGRHSSGLYYVRVNGKMKYLPRNIDTEDAAQIEVAKLRLEYAGIGAQPQDQDKTIKNLVALYLEKANGKSTDRNYKNKVRYLTKFTTAHGNMLPEQLSPLVIESFIQSIPHRNVGNGSYHAYAHLAACFNWLVTKRVISSSPMQGVERPQQGKRTEEYIIEPPEWAKMLPLLRGEVYRQVAQVLWLCGARPGEIINATVDEWDADSRTLTKKQHKTARKGKRRIIKMPQEAARIVSTAIGARKQGIIFPLADGRPACGDWLSQMMQHAAQKIGRTNPVIAYSLRHSFAVRNLENNTSIQQVAAWLGNTVAVCEKHYAHTIDRLKSKTSTIEPC